MTDEQMDRLLALQDLETKQPLTEAEKRELDELMNLPVEAGDDEDSLEDEDDSEDE